MKRRSIPGDWSTESPPHISVVPPRIDRSFPPRIDRGPPHIRRNLTEVGKKAAMCGTEAAMCGRKLRLRKTAAEDSGGGEPAVDIGKPSARRLGGYGVISMGTPWGSVWASLVIDAFFMRMHPWLALVPRAPGWLVPWMPIWPSPRPNVCSTLE